MNEAAFLRAVDQQVFLVKRLLSSPAQEIQTIVLDYMNRLIAGEEIAATEAESMIARVVKTGTEMQRLWTAFSGSVIKGAYQFGVRSVLNILQSQSNFTARGADAKTLGVLLSDMVQDFGAVQRNGQAAILSYFKLSQQGALTEQMISEAVASGLIRKNTVTGSVSDLTAAFQRALQSPAARSEQVQLLAQMAQQKGLDAAAKQMLFADYQQALRDGKILLLVNKNGDVMRYQTATYSEMVARSRIADAQVQGTIDTSQANDVDTFQVTIHHTTTEICKPHEGKVYTTNPANKKFPFLTEERRPIYHPNCRHRLVPKVYTQAQLAAMPDYIEGEDDE